MKLIKILLIMLFLAIPSVHAQDTIEYAEEAYVMEENIETADVATIDEMMEGDEAVEEMTPKQEFLALLTKFVSSGILAFILCLGFPKFFKKTGAVLLERNKFRIFFEAARALFILVTIAMLGVFLMVGMYPALLAFSIVMSLYFLGVPVFSIGIMEWLFEKKGIKFNKLNKKNKLISLLSINLIIMLFVLPLALFIPNFETVIQDQVVSVDIVSNLFLFIISMLGMGMVVIRLHEILVKNQKKL